ncbi:MAG: lysozyme [Alphaproteobacteria bacterium]
MNSLIKKYEGCLLVAYKCPAGVWTIGYGNTSVDGVPVYEGMSITEERAEILLSKWIDCEVMPYISDLNLRGRQLEAVVSLVYNVGGPAFKKSKLRQAIINKDFEAICREWDFGFKSKLKGIYKRRVEELFFFISEI